MSFSKNLTSEEVACFQYYVSDITAVSLGHRTRVQARDSFQGLR